MLNNNRLKKALFCTDENGNISFKRAEGLNVIFNCFSSLIVANAERIFVELDNRGTKAYALRHILNGEYYNEKEANIIEKNIVASYFHYISMEYRETDTIFIRKSSFEFLKNKLKELLEELDPEGKYRFLEYQTRYMMDKLIERQKTIKGKSIEELGAEFAENLLLPPRFIFIIYIVAFLTFNTGREIQIEEIPFRLKEYYIQRKIDLEEYISRLINLMHESKDLATINNCLQVLREINLKSQEFIKAVEALLNLNLEFEVKKAIENFIIDLLL